MILPEYNLSVVIVQPAICAVLSDASKLKIAFDPDVITNLALSGVTSKSIELL
jgi:hypothetical protein